MNPENAMAVVESIKWNAIINPSFELVAFSAFLIYVISVGLMAAILNINSR